MHPPKANAPAADIGDGDQIKEKTVHINDGDIRDRCELVIAGDSELRFRVEVGCAGGW